MPKVMDVGNNLELGNSMRKLKCLKDRLYWMKRGEKKRYIYCILVSYRQSLYVFFPIRYFGGLFGENKKTSRQQ